MSARGHALRDDLDDRMFAATELRLFDASDLPWIRAVVDLVMSCQGEPWRVLREQLEHAPIRAPRAAAIVTAMRRVMGGRADRARIARKVRAHVLGHPVLDEPARQQRLAHAEQALGIAAAELESLLWVDLAEERPVQLPDGRPDEQQLAAFANADRIARALRRAHHVRIHAWGNAHPLIRMAARVGLLVRVSGADMATAVHRDDAEILLDIIGPLALFHQTTVYGRALTAIVPMLSVLDRFVVEIDADFGYGAAALRVASPALLPPMQPMERGKPSVATRIARALLATGALRVVRDPAPIAHGRDRLYPDLAIAPLAQGDAADDDGRATDDTEDGDGGEDRALDDDRDLVPDLTAQLAAQMAESAQQLARRSGSAHGGALRDREQPVRDDDARDEDPRAREDEPASLDPSSCWYLEVVGFATADFLAAKRARYAGAGIERVIFVVDETRAMDDVGSSAHVGAEHPGHAGHPRGSAHVGAGEPHASAHVGAGEPGHAGHPRGSAHVGAGEPHASAHVGAGHVLAFTPTSIAKDVLALVAPNAPGRRPVRRHRR